MKMSKGWTMFVVLLLLCSSIVLAIDVTATAKREENGTSDVQMSEEETIINGTLTETFLELKKLVADNPVVYLDAENILYISIENTGGSVGDERYKADITDSIGDIESLKENTSSKPAKKLLRKAIFELEDALVDISEGERKSSFEHLVNATAFLKAAGNMGVDTGQVLTGIGILAGQKVGTVIDQAESNFGSESPDVQKGKFFFEQGEEKLENDKYVPAVAMFRQSFKKVLGAYTCDANVTVKDVIYRKSEEEIGMKIVSNLEAEEEATVELSWIPDEVGIHYINVNLTGDYMVYSSPGSLESSSPYIVTSAFPVSPQGSIEYWDNEDLRTIYPGETRNRTGPVTIYVIDGDLTIKGPNATDPGGVLNLKGAVTLVMMNPERGKYSINIESGGTFKTILGDAGERATIQCDLNSPDYAYHFINHGTVDFTGADITYIYGDKNDLTQPGGIRNLEGSTCNLNNCSVVSADTHSVYVGNGVSSLISGKETVIGSDVDPGASEVQKGHGIWVEESNPDINNISVKYNQMSGISCVNTTEPIIKHNIVSFNDMHGIDLQGSDALISEIKVSDNGGNGINCIGGSAPTLNGSTTEIFWNEGRGIFADCSHPKVDGITVERNRAEGIFIENALDSYGKPSYTPGTDLGTFVWWDEGGWLLRFSSDDSKHVFDGEVISNGDKLSFSKTVPAGEERVLDIGDYEKVTVEVYLDGQLLSEYVFVGSSSGNPSSLPVTLQKNVGYISNSNICYNFESGILMKYSALEVHDNNINNNGMALIFRDDMTPYRMDSGEETLATSNPYIASTLQGNEQLNTSVDHSTSKYFPPIGRQEGPTCGPWATVYYQRTFQEAKRRDWDLSEAKWDPKIKGPEKESQDKIMSPYFYLHTGSQNYDALSDIGVSSWKEYPVSLNASGGYNSSRELPDESAWREAPLYRSGEEIRFDLKEDGLYNLKKWLSDGNMAQIIVNAHEYINLINNTLLDLFSLNRSEYEKYIEEGPINETLRKVFEDKGHLLEDDARLSNYDVGMWRLIESGDKRYEIEVGNKNLNISNIFLWTNCTYEHYVGGHENTIVGYDDDYGPYKDGEDENGNPINRTGAFKVVNQWGDQQFHDKGAYWMSYEAVRWQINTPRSHLNNDDGYEPKLVAVFNVTHPYIHHGRITIGTPNSSKFFHISRSSPYPNNNIVLDITELNYSSGTDIYMKFHGGDYNGTINSFSVEYFEEYSTDPSSPRRISYSTDPPVYYNASEGKAVYANLTLEGIWNATGMWHLVKNEPGAPTWNISHSGDWSWWFGNDSTGNYDNGIVNGTLTLNDVYLKDAEGSAFLTFWSWYETDTYGTETDRRCVTISNNNISKSVQLSGEQMRTWIRHTIDISEFIGTYIDVEYEFDSLTDEDNAHQGWYIDNLEVIADSPNIEGHGIELEGNTHSNINNNTITSNNWQGIQLSNSLGSVIRDNDIIGNKKTGFTILSSVNNEVKDNTVSSNKYRGIYLYSSNNNIVYNNNASNNNYGILLESSNNNYIANNTVSNNDYGILLKESENTMISENAISSNNEAGTYLLSSQNNTISGNIVNLNTVYGILLNNSDYIDILNNVVCYNKYGIYISQSNNNTIDNNSVSNNDYGISIKQYERTTTNEDVAITSINGEQKFHSQNNTISGNNINSNSEYGIWLDNSYNNDILSNYAHNNEWGIYAHESNNNTIKRNNVSYNYVGVGFIKSDGNTVRNNEFSINTYGIILWYVYENMVYIGSDYNLVYNNNITYNDFGIFIKYSDDNVIYHNNFIFNENQAYNEGGNYWDNGYPSGGNYWSDYDGVDEFSGPDQNEPGSDGIGDTPYNFTNSQDSYPLMEPTEKLARFEIDLFAYPESDGWNFVSIPIEPLDTSVPNIFISVEGSYDKVMAFQCAREEVLYTSEDSADWKSYVPGRDEQYNNLEIINRTHGFWIQMTEDATLTVYGYEPEDGKTEMLLEPGWNMVGYPSDTLRWASETLPSEVTKIGVFNKHATYNLEYFYDLSNVVLAKGRGYWVYNGADYSVVWTVEY